MSRAKFWSFTSFDVENLPVYDVSRHQYLCYGLETCPKTGRRHVQGFVAFIQRQRLSQLQKWIPHAHFEKSKGTAAQNVEYCKKDGAFTEYGTIPCSNKSKSPFAAVLSAAEVGDVEQIKNNHPGMYIRYCKTISALRRFDTEDLTDSCGFWIHGLPRTGKDYSVRKLGDVYVKPLNKWWDGYIGQKHVLISDVDPNHGWLGTFLKIWCDRYPFAAEIKGGTIFIRPKLVFITSNFTMEQCFKEELIPALAARFAVIDADQSPPLYKPRPVFKPAERVWGVLRDIVNIPEDVSPVQPSTSSSLTSAEKEALCAAEPASPSSEDDFEIPKKAKLRAVKRKT